MPRNNINQTKCVACNSGDKRRKPIKLTIRTHRKGHKVPFCTECWMALPGRWQKSFVQVPYDNNEAIPTAIMQQTGGDRTW